MKEPELVELEGQSHLSRPHYIPATILTHNKAASIMSKDLQMRFQKSLVPDSSGSYPWRQKGKWYR